jgi:hypothetical protein
MYSKFCGNVVIIEIVAKYDTKIVCPLLAIDEVDIYFGRVVSINDVILSTFKNELRLFCQLLV